MSAALFEEKYSVKHINVKYIYIISHRYLTPKLLLKNLRKLVVGPHNALIVKYMAIPKTIATRNLDASNAGMTITWKTV